MKFRKMASLALLSFFKYALIADKPDAFNQPRTVNLSLVLNSDG